MCPESGIIEQIQKSEEQYRRAFENAPSGICVAGLDGSILRVNAALCRMVGYSEEEMLATVWGELDHPDDSGPCLERLEQLLQDPGGSAEAEKRYLHRNGSVVWARTRASMVRDGEGKPLYFVIHFEDITGHERVEDVLHESEERFRIMADGCPTMMWVTNPRGGNQFINRAYREFCGITYEEAEGGKWQLLLHPDDASKYAEQFQRAWQEHTTFKAEARVRRANGEWRWIFSYAEPRFSLSGEFLGHVGLSPDITEHKQAEQMLQFQHSLLRAIHEGSPDGILVVNHEGIVVSHNQRYLDIWQVSQPAIPKDLSVNSKGSPFHEFFSACLNRVKNPGPFLQRVQELYDDPGANDHCEIELKDGRTLERHSSGLRSEDGKYLGRVWFFRDITARKQADREMRSSEERFRQFAENIHEVIWMMPLTAGEKPYVSPAYEQVWGKTRESLYQNPRSWLEVIHPDDLEAAQQRFAAQLAGEATEAQYRILTPDGQEKWIRDRTFPVFNSAGQLIRVVGIAEEITERRKTEQVLQFQNSLIRAIHEVSLDGILVVNDQGVVTSHNKKFLDILQISLPDLQSRLPANAVGTPDEPLLSAFLNLVKDPVPFLKRVRELYKDQGADDHCEIALKDGRTLERYSTGLRSEVGKYLGRVWFFRDITTRKQAEHALQGSEERFRQFAENIQEVVWMMPPAGNKMIYVSPAYEQVWGRTRESLYQNPMAWAEAIHPDDRERARSVFARQIQGEAIDSEYRIQTPDGQEKWIRDRAFPVRDQAGQLIRVVGIAEEITERKSSEAELALTNRALQTSEARYRKLVDLSPNAIIVGQNQATTLVNKAAVELFGFSSASELIGKRFADLVNPESRGTAEELVRRLYECEMQLPLQEGQIRRKEGSLLDVEIAASSFGENGARVVQAVLHNITQRKQAEEEHARLISGIEQVGESIVITNLEGSILYVNPAYEKITGYTRAEVIGRASLMVESDRHPAAFYQSMWATLSRGETWYGELINQRKDGTLFNEEATISPIKNKDGRVINYVAVKRDVTQEHLLRDQLNQAQKMEAVGRLAGGIAHDFNNLLMVIQSYTEMLQDSLPAHDPLRRNTREVMKAAEHGASLTGQMLAFSRKQIICPVVLDLNTVIDETAKMLKRIIGEDIEFCVESAESLWAIKADPDQIGQVLMNLCVNSRDALPQGGTLTIATGNVTVRDGGIGGQARVLPGDYVRLSVSDTGVGISKELQGRIFEPFFTTKEVGKGTGLGLAMVYGIVQQSGGYVWVQSEAGHGTCFTIYLPRVKEAIASERCVMAEARPRGTETLLVAEDADALREAVCDYLRNLGYTVFAANSGQQALLVASQQGHIDLLLTDVVMPQMSGRELSQMLCALRPRLKTIYMSGYTDDAVLRHGILDLGGHFLQKPFSLGTLALKVRETLGGD